MTAPSLSPHTHSVPSLDSTALPAHATPPLPSAQTNGLAEDEEDYTIKCICGFQEDDGSTILCEACQTWQHIDCYYRSQGIPTPGDDEEHTCDDCAPRSKHPNRTKAAEAQRQKREALDFVDPKIKKAPAAKGPKKKKAIDHTVNGGSGEKHNGNVRNGANGSPREGSHPTKRPKAGHRSSNSTQIVPLKLPAQSSRRSTSASHTLQSPSKVANNATHSEGEPYSVEFMHLYDNDPGDTLMEGNLMNDIPTANNLLDWSQDADAVKEATNGRSHQDIFLRCEQSVDDMEKPVIEKHTKVDESREFHGRHPKWTYLTVESPAPKGMVVGELRGKIGHKKDYAQNEANRWEYLTHPLPFVFFHPTLPIYIDTRHEGSLCRYVRRSCNFNLQLVTILEEGPELRFCFCATRDIQPGEELTLAWTPNEHVRNFLSNPELADVGEEYVRNFYAKVLSDFGGCATKESDNCSCYRWSRQLEQKLANGHRSSTHHSSASNGRTSISRSGSEGIKHHDDEERDDDRSTSASSNPNSRGATPLENSEREKRKFNQMLERLSHIDEPKRKRQRSKRASGSTHDPMNPPASASRLGFSEGPENKTTGRIGGQAASLPNTPALPNKTRYVNAGTSQKPSSPSTSSPTTHTSPHLQQNGSMPAPPRPGGFKRPYRPNYVDLAVQCERDVEDWMPGQKYKMIDYQEYVASLPDPPRKKVLTRKEQILRDIKYRNAEMEKAKALYLTSQIPPTKDTRSSSEKDATQSPALPSVVPPLTDQDGDVVMDKDRPTSSHAATNGDDVTGNLDEEAQSSKSHKTESSPVPKIESPQISTSTLPTISDVTMKEDKPLHATGLHIDLPSLVTNATSSAHPATNVAQSPSIQTPTIALQNTHLTPSVSTSLVQPSPVKKKLSLGDYMRRSSTKEKVDATAPVTTIDKEHSPTNVVCDTPVRTLETLTEDAKEKDADLGTGTAIVDTPMVETGDPMTVDQSSA